MTCRNCGAELDRVFVDLGHSPLSNAYLTKAQLDEPEPHFPLRPRMCEECLLVQLPMFETPEAIFGEYDFFSGQSQTWIAHCEAFAADAVRRFGLTRRTRVLELASNDGTMLRKMMRWTPRVTGVEPARNVARHALLQGLPTINRFWGQALAWELVASGYQADLIVANNVLAHVPDLDDFVGGIKHVLAPEGIVVFEVPDLHNLIRDNQFDTIYHEHFSYFSLPTLHDALARRGLQPFHAEAIPTHGGSLRLYARLGEGADVPAALSLNDLAAYAPRPAELKQRVVETLSTLRGEGKSIAGYGAPAKATTFLSYCGIGSDVIEFIVDSTPAKQGKYLPGARVPILHPKELAEREPDVIMVLPWNWRDEVLAKIERECPWRPMVLCRDRVISDGVLAVAA